jgi:hypothetical protein
MDTSLVHLLEADFLQVGDFLRHFICRSMSQLGRERC